MTTFAHLLLNFFFLHGALAFISPTNRWYAVTQQSHDQMNHDSHYGLGTQRTSQSRLNKVIEGLTEAATRDEENPYIFEEDISAIKIKGSLTSIGGTYEPELEDCILYDKLTALPESDRPSSVDLVASGMGKEIYYDPGDTLVETIDYAPSGAVKEALSMLRAKESEGGAPLGGVNHLVLNFLGGENLVLSEVLDAIRLFVADITKDSSSPKQINFNSLSHNSVPVDSCSVTIMSLGNNDGEAANNPMEKAVLSGDIYLHSGNWWTVLEEDKVRDNEDVFRAYEKQVAEGDDD